ncbi:lipase [Winogradskya consettensis]|uniref:Lipase n=1 Tax=Winogradskya consettensis TaxID=113560 RepID=A0A919SPB5_9ACTN|nr:lipase [Actinoplanes consettensis]GIM75062.1 lipase [Actinoplanes consettensis]
MTRGRWIGIGAALGVLMVLVGLVVSVLSRTEDSSPRPDQAAPGTVLLVPGYGGSTSALSRLAVTLRAAGREAKVVTLPGDGTGDLLASADTLEVAVRAELSHGSPSVDVVGYSAGGVVARLWVQRHEGATVARRIVTLGSPLHGTRLARLGAALAPGSCPAACRQLAPDSDLLKEIDGDDLPSGLPWLSLWTENDETVQPPDSARLDGAVNLAVQSLCPGVVVSHSELPTNSIVSALVVQALEETTLMTPEACPA